MSSRIASVVSALLHLAVLLLLSLTKFKFDPQQKIPDGMEIEIVDLQHAMPLPNPEVGGATKLATAVQPTLEAEKSGERNEIAMVPSPEPENQSVTPPSVPRATEPIRQEKPDPAKATASFAQLAPAPVREAKPNAPQETSPESAPVAATNTRSVAAEATAPAKDGNGTTNARAETAPTAGPPKQRLDASALERLLGSNKPMPPASRINSAAIGAVIGKAAPVGRPGMTFRQRINLAELIRSQITPCWNPPIAEEESGQVSVIIRLRLDRNGSIAVPPVVARFEGRTARNGPYSEALAGSVRRAVLRCSPLRLPSELYEAWEDVELNFDPRDVL